MSDTGATVRIQLPLPLDIVGEVMDAIGKKYPNAVIKTNDPGRDLVLSIPDTDRYFDDSFDDDGFDDDELDDLAGDPLSIKTAIAPAVKSPKSLKDYEADLAAIKDGQFSMSVPEYFSNLIMGMAKTILDDAEAPNYLEMQVIDKSTGEDYAVYAVRPGGKTPHQARIDAENEAEDLRRELAEALGLLEANGISLPTE